MRKVIFVVCGIIASIQPTISFADKPVSDSDYKIHSSEYGKEGSFISDISYIMNSDESEYIPHTTIDNVLLVGRQSFLDFSSYANMYTLIGSEKVGTVEYYFYKSPMGTFVAIDDDLAYLLSNKNAEFWGAVVGAVIGTVAYVGRDEYNHHSEVEAARNKEDFVSRDPRSSDNDRSQATAERRAAEDKCRTCYNTEYFNGGRSRRGGGEL